MARRGIDHETYQRIQTEIDTVLKHVRRTYSQTKGAYEVMDTQRRVMALLNLPRLPYIIYRATCMHACMHARTDVRM